MQTHVIVSGQRNKTKAFAPRLPKNNRTAKARLLVIKCESLIDRNVHGL